LFLGHSDQALRKSDEAVAAAEALEHPYTHAFSLAFAAFVRQNLEMRSATQKMATKAIQISDENEFQFWAKQQLVLLSWAESQLGGTKAGTVEIRRALDSFLESGPIIGSTRILSLMAEVYIDSGRTDEGLAMLERALHTANKTGEKFYLAEILRLEAELCLIRPGKKAISEICTYFRRSLDVSEDQNAVFWQLRTARSIARLGQKIHRQEEVSNRLLNMCDVSDEGCDTTEAIGTARDLLDRLSQRGGSGNLDRLDSWDFGL
jgi:ATP/maltotriose-dependent transcriptional regulator MalT